MRVDEEIIKNDFEVGSHMHNSDTIGRGGYTILIIFSFAF